MYTDEFTFNRPSPDGPACAIFYACSPGVMSDLEICKVWWRIIGQYFDTKLTRKEDRRRAIIGLIAEMQRRTGWVNAFGLWGPYIIRELWWCRAPGSDGSRTGLNPSWSSQNSIE